MTKRLISYLLLAPLVFISGIFLVSPSINANPLVCNMQTFSGEDDVAHRMDIPFSLYLGSTDYNTVYLTTNGTMTFGQPDPNYWSYPETPSVSLAGWDWVTWGEGAYVSYGYNSNSFCIEWSVRPFPQSTGDLTQIRLVVNKYPNSSWHGEIVTFGWLPENNRRGIRFESGQEVVLIQAAFDVNGGVPIEVAPAPAPSSFEEPVVIPTEEATPQPTASESESIQPTPLPTEQTPTPEPTETALPLPTETPYVDPYPTSTPSESPLQPVVPEITPSPTPEPQTSSPLPLIPDQVESPSPDPIDSSILPSDNSTTESFTILDNGVVLEKDVAEALEIFDSADMFLAAIIGDPGKVIKAFANIGADMTPEKRKEAQQVTISVIVYAQLMNGLSTANMLMRRF